MSNTTYNLNRPVHLARRDVFVEQAMALCRKTVDEKVLKKRLHDVDVTLYCVQSALEHASLAAKATTSIPSEESFVQFLRLVLCHLQSVRSLIENEAQLQNTASPLCQFLASGTSAGEAVQFAHSSEQHLTDVTHLFKIAAIPFQELRTTLFGKLSDEEKTRYTRAGERLRELTSSPHHFRSLTYGQTSYPVLEMRYG